MDNPSTSAAPWKPHLQLLKASQGLRMQISHAFSGVTPGYHGQDCFPINRLYWALDDCGEIRWQQSKKSLRLIPGSITFMPPQIDLEYKFNKGRMVALHFNLEIFSGLDLFAQEKQCDFHEWICKDYFAV